MNLALVTVDSLRADHVGCYGYDRETTPTLNALADEAHLFSTAVAHACATRPSFPSLLTSTHGLLYGGFDHLSADRVPLSEPLSEAGYATAGFHSNAYLSAEFGYDRGFDTFSDFVEDPGLLSRVRRYVANNVQGPVKDVLSWVHAKTEEHAGVDVGAYYKNATDLTDEALAWVERAPEPWFLWVHYMDPHHPYVPPEDHQQFGASLSQRRGVKLRQRVLQDPDDLSAADWDDLERLYDAEVRYVDEEVGRLLNGLDRATWLLTADHGEEFYDHGNFGHKNRFYEEHVHVPLLVGRSDGESPALGPDEPTVQDHLVGLNDVPVTLLEAADVPVPDSYRGRNLFDGGRDRVVGAWAPDAGTSPEQARFMCRTETGKYIVDTDTGDVEFYDLERDPDESENRADTADTTEYERAVEEFEAAVEQTAQTVERRSVDEEVERQLESLGYRD